jgi:hypothetical protein
MVGPMMHRVPMIVFLSMMSPVFLSMEGGGSVERNGSKWMVDR